MPIEIPEALRSIALEPLFDIELSVGEVQKLGLADATRQVGIVTGGRFEGKRLRGTVLAGGSDWQTIAADGTVGIDCRIVLRTDAGENIAMHYRGLRTGPAEVLAKLGRSEVVDPLDYYFRINPMFETDAPQCAWLNRVVAIGTGHRRATGPVYRIFALL